MSDEPRPISIAELVGGFRSLIEGAWPRPIPVVGEISNLRRYPSGHAYFTLKDTDAEVSCVMFARDLQANNHGVMPAEGDLTEAMVRPTVYELRGRLQLRVLRIRKQGQGDMHARFLELKQQLRAKGWFAAEHKRPLPEWPEKIAVVVSTEGAAWHDVQTTLAARFPLAQVWLFAAPAQGVDAAAKIAAAIGAAGNSGCDVMLVVRGGGSLEDLWAYNEIEVASAIREAPIPVIAGIGHETDETIADYVADLRAPTPTGAAVAAVPCRDELLAGIDERAQRLSAAAGDCIATASQRLDEAGAATVQAGEQLVQVAQLRLSAAAANLAGGCKERIAAAGQRLESASGTLATQLRLIAGGTDSLRLLAGRLEAAASVFAEQLGARSRQQAQALAAVMISRLREAKRTLTDHKARLHAAGPQQTLERGYAIVAKDDGAVVDSASQLQPGEVTAAIFA
ncbi:MAG: exodeoxyribonuclease VII large subunit, partial [Betaproteobacteria bacterium]|nr:exodeoxyribonuclease VII large subunit [Betaproteobacteria bacterium]